MPVPFDAADPETTDSRSYRARGAIKPTAFVSPFVTDDATLSDFASDDEDETGTTGTSTENVDGTGARTDESGLSTYAWGEYTCSQCDSPTDHVWRADGDLVCPDCKGWSSGN